MGAISLQNYMTCKSYLLSIVDMHLTKVLGAYQPDTPSYDGICAVLKTLRFERILERTWNLGLQILPHHLDAFGSVRS